MTAARAIDVLVIGAGVNGAGVFRDLCAQGLTCAIVDKGDFGSGTSAAPSRLIHGGLKYLETGELRLVAESTFERNLLLRNAPHLVHPLKTVIPIFSWFKGISAAVQTMLGSTTAPRSRGAVLIKIGLALYDFYGRRRRVMPTHSLWSKTRARREIPAMTDKAVAAGTYYDALVTAPERLVMELVQDGLQASAGSTALTYAHVDAITGPEVQVLEEDGTPHRFVPKVVVNAAGPWIDRVNERLGLTAKLIGGTKGSHIVVDNHALVSMLDGRMIYYEANDGRICLVYDYLGKALIGSTDIRASDPDNAVCEDDEIDYFLDSLADLLPGIAVSRDQIVYTYSGVRPLPASDDTAVGLISRDHSAPVSEPDESRPFPIVSLVGGKWTTFRGFSEEAADLILARLNATRRVSTREMAIGGGADHPTDHDAWCAEFADAARAKSLLNRYGTTARHILDAENGAPRMLGNTIGYSEQEISWIAQNEQVAHLSDIVIRRTTLAVCGLLSAASLTEIASVAGQALGWDTTRKDEEIEQTRKVLRERHHQIL